MTFSAIGGYQINSGKPRCLSGLPENPTNKNICSKILNVDMPFISYFCVIILGGIFNLCNLSYVLFFPLGFLCPYDFPGSFSLILDRTWTALET